MKKYKITVGKIKGSTITKPIRSVNVTITGRKFSEKEAVERIMGAFYSGLIEVNNDSKKGYAIVHVKSLEALRNEKRLG